MAMVSGNSNSLQVNSWPKLVGLVEGLVAD